MKTAERGNPNRWAAMFGTRADGAASQNRPSSSSWGWKQEKLQQWGECFRLTSPSIERVTDLSRMSFSERVRPGLRAYQELLPHR